MHRLIQLSNILDRLVRFDDKPRRNYGEVAKDAAVGGITSAVGTAGLLAGAGMLLKRKAPDLAGMLRTASGQHIKVFNPAHTIPMMHSLPEASRLFGKQMRAVKEVESLATSKGTPSLATMARKYAKSGIKPARDIQEISDFKKKWGRTPGDTMEKSVGLLSGMAATGVGVAGGAALSKGWRKNESENLSALLSNLIEFKTLYVPGKKDEPPETIPKLEGVVDYTVQRHAAKRAGLHRDVRIGTRRHGLLSWATRKDLPAEGSHIALHPQPVHSHSYLGWEGDIPEGRYGAGNVSTEHIGKALITKSTPTEVHATLADQKEHHRLALIKTAKGWLMTRGKHPEPPPEASKPSYKSVEPSKAHETFESLPPGSIVQPKVDGALVYVSTKGNRPEIFSHRKGKQSGEHIVHTERFFHGRPTTQIPKEHQRTLIGELYGTRKGKAIEPQELGGILNTHLGESIAKQKKKGVDLKIMPFDYAGGKESYPERLAKVKETLSYMKGNLLHVPEGATSQQEVKQLFENIRKGKHPLTKEGVIIHPPEGKMIKIKNTSEENVKIHSVFPGKGKHKHGGFYYADESGQPLGRVGTGFTDETRAELPKYIGRTARVKYQEKFKSGKLRAPSLIAIEENK